MMTTTSSEYARRRRFAARWRVLLSCIVTLLLSITTNVSFALDPPRPGEIAQLKRTGEFPQRLERARALGNNRIEKERLERALNKAKRQALLQKGLPAGQVLSEPPPSWKLMPTKGNVKVFALLIDFPDYPAYNAVNSIDNALFGDGSILANSPPYESLTAYYERSSYNQLHLSGVTLGWYRPSFTRASMPQTTEAREALIKEAVEYFHANGQDFSQFDNDGNGQIEYFIVIWTGPDNGWANFWWAYQDSFYDSNFTVDGKTLGKYSWQMEYGSGGSYAGPYQPSTVIHETGHALGVPDYYDYDGNVGPDGGVGNLDIMDGVWGDHNCFSKWTLDWITPTVVASGSQSVTLNPSGTSGDAVVVMPGATSDDSFREFFMVQNRYRAANDVGYPTDGMLIWHVDARLNGGGTDYLYNNSTTSHKLLKLVEADGGNRIEEFEAWADAAMYFQPGNLFTPLSAPSSKDYLGVDSRVNVTGIAQSWPQMSATFSIDDPAVLRTLMVVKDGIGSGTVTSDPEGISFGSDDRESYLPGTAVTLTAVPAPGSRFTGWSGGGCSGTGSCTVTLSADKTVTATFDATVVWAEDFSLGDLPGGWERHITSGEGWWWFMTEYNTSGGLTHGALGGPYGAGPYDLALHTMSFDLSGMTNVGLEFKTAISDSQSTADVDVSTDGGFSWTNLWRWGGSLLAKTVNVDLSSAAGEADVMLRFRTYGGGVWWSIDDVRVTLAPPAAAPLDHFELVMTSPQTAGHPFGMVVVARDANGETVSGYTGTVHFTSTDGAATLPADYTFTADDHGFHSFSDIVLRTAGSGVRITVADAAAGVSVTGSVYVFPADAASFTVTAPATANAGVPVTVTVTAKDQFNNVAREYNGTVHFTSSDGAALLPADATLNLGTGTFQATLLTPGNQTITATDSVNQSVTGSSAAIGVLPAQVADLTIVKNHYGNFRQGQSGASYTIRVANSGVAATTGTVTVTDSLPAGLTAIGIRGSGWTCNTSTMTCTRRNALFPGYSYPPITVTVKVAGNAPATVTNVASVFGGGEVNAFNNTTSDETVVIPALPDLTVRKSHFGSFRRGQTGASYTIAVRNSGTSRTSGQVTVVDTLPAGLTATSIRGTGWSCNLDTLTCVRRDQLAPGGSYPPVTVKVNVRRDASYQVTNLATVSGGGESNTSNNTASDPTIIRP